MIVEATQKVKEEKLIFPTIPLMGIYGLLNSTSSPFRGLICKISTKNPGDEVLSQGPCEPSIVPAATFHYPVRNGKEWYDSAQITGKFFSNQCSVFKYVNT